MAGNIDAQAFMAAIINAANAAAAAAAATAHAAGPAPVVARPFARLPGMQNNLPLDYQKPEDYKVFLKSSEGFDEKFELKDDKLGMFLAKIKDRSDIYNWNEILSVPDDNAIARNIVTNFGQITIDNCRAHVLSFINLQGRNAQNDVMLYFLLVNSLTELARTNSMHPPASNYTNITGVAGVGLGLEVVPSGIMLLKIIIGKSTVDTKAKVLLLRQEVASLSYKMMDMKGDIVEFNLYAQRKRDELLSRGQSVDELIAHLFSAYLRSPDENFVRYIQSKKDMYEENGNVTADELMSLALVKHELIKQQTAAVNEGDERIIAMRATHSEVNSNNISDERFLAMEASLRLMQERLTTAQGRGGRANNGRNKRNDQSHAWKKVKPKDGEPQVKVFSGRTYHWCRFHEAWTMHLPADCTLGHQQPAAAAAAPAAARGTYATAAHRAMLAMMHDEDAA